MDNSSAYTLMLLSSLTPRLRWTHGLARLCSDEHDTPFPAFVAPSRPLFTAAAIGIEPMAETQNRLRTILERIRDDAQQALTLLEDSAQQRSLHWQCAKCGHVKYFTRPALAEIARPCPKCGGESFFN